MGITLDGIAVGYIVDRVSELLVSRGIQNHLVNASGRYPDQRRQGRRKALDRGDSGSVEAKTYPDVVHMGDGAISTSGNYEIFYDQEKSVPPHREPENRPFPGWSDQRNGCRQHDHGSGRAGHRSVRHVPFSGNGVCEWSCRL